MKRLFLLFLVFSVATGAFAQLSLEIGAISPERLGIDSAQQFLREISIDRFERDGFWSSSMSSDTGYASSRLFMGSPLAKQVIPEEEGMNIQDAHTLGTRVDFLRRGFTDFFITPSRPLHIEGITKTVSVWAVGRNYYHSLYLQIEDFFGRPFELFMGRLNFQGWKRMTVAIPPQAEDGFNGIVQRNYHYNNDMGIKITGFRIAVDPWQAYGSYYLYLDDLRAVTDLFAESNRDPDDMMDGW